VKLTVKTHSGETFEIEDKNFDPEKFTSDMKDPEVTHITVGKYPFHKGTIAHVVPSSSKK
jgi:hypothetical protein